MADESKNGEGGVCVALDVGDTTAKVAVFHGDRLMVIANEQGNRVTPCAVSFTEHELLVGEAAGRKAAKNAKNTILGWRWFIGRKFSPAEVTALAKVSATASARQWHTRPQWHSRGWCGCRVRSTHRAGIHYASGCGLAAWRVPWGCTSVLRG